MLSHIAFTGSTDLLGSQHPLGLQSRIFVSQSRAKSALLFLFVLDLPSFQEDLDQLCHFKEAVLRSLTWLSLYGALWHFRLCLLTSFTKPPTS